jgi:hypothetical protein
MPRRLPDRGGSKGLRWLDEQIRGDRRRLHDNRVTLEE